MANYQAQDHSFVLCAYKESPYLEAALKSLLAQSVKPAEVLIATSTPNEHIASVAEKYRVRLCINPAPKGNPAADWNFGCSCAKTPLVTIAHQDDLYEPCYLEEMLRWINRYEPDEVQIVFSDYAELRGERLVHNNLLLKVKRLMNAPFARRAFNGSKFVRRSILSLGCSICCPSVMLNVQVVGTEPFDERYRNSCDFKTWVNMSAEQGRFLYVPKCLMAHRIHADSATTANIEDSLRRKEDLEIFSELWPRPIARLWNHLYAKSEKANSL